MESPDPQDAQDIVQPEATPQPEASAQPENYAKTILIHSFPLALTFTLLYIPLLGIYLFRAVRNPTYILWILAFFCQVRVVSFAMRTALTRSEAAGENFDLVLAQQIVYGAGFFGVLYSAYIMVLDRGVIKGTSGTTRLLRLTGNRHFLRLVLVAAVTLSITGAVQANTGSKEATINLGKHLKTIAVVLFMLVAGFLVLHTILSIAAERRASDEKDHSSLAPYGLYLLLMIALMLFVREIYFLATTGQLTQYKERLFYPFAAGTELAAVLFFLLPGIVPLKRELVEATR